MYCKNCGQELKADQGYCENCGVYAGSGNRFCDRCGTEATEDAAFCANCGAALKKEQPYGEQPVTGTIFSEDARANIQTRNLVTSIILSIVTCGIYGIYWFIVLTDEINLLTKEEKDLSGALSFVLSLVTCGIYSYIWAYKMGQKVDKLNGNKDGSSGILYLLLVLFGLGIVNYALIQETINKTVEAR